MTIRVIKEDDCTVILIPASNEPEFKELIQRGTNLWPDASADIKIFADLITNGGEVQQDYRGQSVTKLAPRYSYLHRCSCGNVTTVYTIVQIPPEYPITCEAALKVEIVVKENDGTETLKPKMVPCKRMEQYNPAVFSMTDILNT